MSLNDTKIRTLKSPAKPIKLSDSDGLYLHVKPSGSRLWYLRYFFAGKESRIALGAYPLVSLAQARQKRDELRRQLAQNINPMHQRALEKAARSPEKCLKAVALDWHNKNKTWSQNHKMRLLVSMHNHIFPAIGHMLVSELKARHFIDLLKAIENRGALEVASRTRQHLCSIMRHAVHQDLIEHNPVESLKGITTPPPKRHHPALCLSALPLLQTRIEQYQQGRVLTRLALKLTLHLFVRSSELRFARWEEFNLKQGLWTLPATREAIPKVRYSERGAKMKTAHLVPLSHQAITLLEEIKIYSGESEFVFPGDHNPHKPMCENALNKALRTMGYNTRTEICGHGFRTLACSALMESGRWPQDAVERQMSHQERNSVRAAYIHKAQYLEARKAMMQWWSDYLDANRESYVAPYLYEWVLE
ncbi:integrase arm-type DNA-binding domain-containing protein [Citrobacter sp. JGM124]|uniref:tyrosine-type recombinase/integrase n=1 Tax=Citrobacter sp. JGM124 TaxID=2799789 RepID=UPI001BA6F469|nr:integrase arm-type DNA-binding domain-containing protein [Citrobacter sp. JGM124]MBS0847055.1 tyrosine-type recombinase/integrase [Citrobacter sp. JGM124]